MCAGVHPFFDLAFTAYNDGRSALLFDDGFNRSRCWKGGYSDFVLGSTKALLDLAPCILLRSKHACHPCQQALLVPREREFKVFAQSVEIVSRHGVEGFHLQRFWVVVEVQKEALSTGFDGAGFLDAKQAQQFAKVVV